MISAKSGVIISRSEKLIAAYSFIFGNTWELFVCKYLPTALCAYSAFHYRLHAGSREQPGPSDGLVLSEDYLRRAVKKLNKGGGIERFQLYQKLC